MPSLADRWRWAAVMIVGGCSAAAGAQDLDLVNATLEEMSRLGIGMVVVGR